MSTRRAAGRPRGAWIDSRLLARWLLAPLASAATLCTASTLEAAEAHRVVVFPIVPLAGDVQLGPARDMSEAVFEELRINAQIDLISLEETGNQARLPSTASAEDYRQALLDLREGAQQARSLRFPAAIAAYESGIEGLHANLEFLDSHERLIEAYLQLSVAYFRRGKDRAGVELLENVVRLDPARTLEPDRFPPLFLTAFSEAKERVLNRPRGAIRVLGPGGADPQADEDGLDVELNGRPLGRTPLLIDEVISGINHVLVRGRSGVWAQRVDVPERSTVEVEAQPGGAPTASGPAAGPMWRTIATNRFDRDVRRLAARRASAAGGRWVVVLSMARARGVYSVGGFLGNVRTGGWMRLDPVAPDFDLFSAAIEAHALGRTIVRAIGRFEPDLAGDSVPFFEGKRARAAPVARASDNRARFIDGRRKREGDVNPHALVPPPRRAGSKHNESQQARLPTNERLADVPPPDVEPGGVTIVEGRAIAAIDPVHAEGEPLQEPGIQTPAPGPASVLDQWWFWTAVGVAAVGLGVGTWALLRDPAADEVRVEAVW